MTSLSTKSLSLINALLPLFHKHEIRTVGSESQDVRFEFPEGFISKEGMGIEMIVMQQYKGF